jgi:hypothetical protein
VQRKLLVALVLAAALAGAALAGVERLADRHPNVDVPQHAGPISEPALPSAVEASNIEPSASPSLTR